MRLALALALVGTLLCLRGPARAAIERNPMPAYYNEHEPFAWRR